MTVRRSWLAVLGLLLLPAPGLGNAQHGGGQAAFFDPPSGGKG